MDESTSHAEVLATNTFVGTADTPQLKISVAQQALRLAEEDWRLRRVEALVRAAVRDDNPAIVELPEAYNTPNVHHTCLRRTPVPIDGAPYQLLKRMAREHGCWVSGGYVAMRGSQPRHSYVIAEPDGTTYIHDKWHYMKLHGRARYRCDLRMGRFAWQGREHTDLPGCNPGTSKTEPSASGGPGPFDFRTTSKPARPLAQRLFHRCWAAPNSMEYEFERNLTSLEADPQMRLPELPTGDQRSDKNALPVVAE